MSLMQEQLDRFFERQNRPWVSVVTDSWIAHHVQPWNTDHSVWRHQRLTELARVSFLEIEEEP